MAELGARWGAGSWPCPPLKSEPLWLPRVASGKGAQGWESFEGGGCSQKSSKGDRVLVCLLFGSWLAQPERLLPAYSTRPFSPPNEDRHPLAHSHLHNHSLQPVGPPTPSHTHGAYGSGEFLSHEDASPGPPVPPQLLRAVHSILNPILISQSQLRYTQLHPWDIILHGNDHCEDRKINYERL